MNEPDAAERTDGESVTAPNRLEEAAGEERASRRWKETYGRGGAAPFGSGGWRRTMGRPGVVPGKGGDWRVALQAYVTGHDLGRDSERKLSDGIRVTGRIDRAERGREVEAGGAESGASAEARPGTRRIPVPERLDFHRSAGTWRRHLPLGRRGGRDARDDDTAR